MIANAMMVVALALLTHSETQADNEAAQAPDPSGKLYEKFEMARGFYIGSDLGVFLVFGGAAQGKSVSNLQPYVGLNLGYDFNTWFSWQVHAGRGFAAASP